jgi:hypothetical protein
VFVKPIADKVPACWTTIATAYGFNGWSDGWAAYIVLEKLRLVQFTVDSNPFASVPNDRLKNELPATSMREFMLGIQPDEEWWRALKNRALWTPAR